MTDLGTKQIKIILLPFQGLHESVKTKTQITGGLITPTPGSRYYTSPQASKRLNRTTILQNISQSVRNKETNVTIHILSAYRNINLFPIRPAQIMTDLRID